ncbi:hypothetical protein NA2_02829 [Nitratireductor pacificus pht-3B]|uniref:Uncharacterized protein n=2 Tax=Nitratireductor TaxID=245876 RepID=K2LSI3_9HYPH|nr:hypothetical protein NA2_02829 [Nitratireductor pacificus pht-3B]
MSLAGFAALLATGCTSVDKTVQLGVGETKHLTAYRADNCGAPAPSYANVSARLPKAKTIRYSDGGLRSRNSKQCGRQVPTRAINATGVAAGDETHRYQDTIRIVVK